MEINLFCGRNHIHILWKKIVSPILIGVYRHNKLVQLLNYKRFKLYKKIDYIVNFKIY